MSFHAFDVSLDLVRSLRAPLLVIGRHDRSLCDQLRRAASSVTLNVAEGNRRKGGDRVQLFRVAAGSAKEVDAALRVVAEAWDYVDAQDIAPALALCDRMLAMLWRLTA